MATCLLHAEWSRSVSSCSRNSSPLYSSDYILPSLVSQQLTVFKQWVCSGFNELSWFYFACGSSLILHAAFPCEISRYCLFCAVCFMWVLFSLLWYDFQTRHSYISATHRQGYFLLVCWLQSVEIKSVLPICSWPWDCCTSHEATSLTEHVIAASKLCYLSMFQRAYRCIGKNGHCSSPSGMEKMPNGFLPLILILQPSVKGETTPASSSSRGPFRSP